MRPPTPPPALLASTSTWSRAASEARASSAAAPGFDRSASITAGAGCPAAAISSASDSSCGRRRAATASRAPLAASCFASSRPIPLEAPVSSTRLPAIVNESMFLLLESLSTTCWDAIKRHGKDPHGPRSQGEGGGDTRAGRTAPARGRLRGPVGRGAGAGAGVGAERDLLVLPF